MSAGHRHQHTLTRAELDDLLAEALANPKIKERLARPYRLITAKDIALLGSSSVGGGKVYLDRHLRHSAGPYGVIRVQGRMLNVKPGLIRHERLEQALEDELGWPYQLAHEVATEWEERDYKAKGFGPRQVEKAFAPYIKRDEHERIQRSPTDLDLRPEMAPPVSNGLIDKINATAQHEKLDHSKVAYVDPSNFKGSNCGKCSMFIEPKYGGPACTLVKSPIDAAGVCRRFARGILGDSE